jgi:hypothetical protein
MQISQILSWAIFIPTLILVLVLLISVIFPALILGTFETSFPIDINIFELGVFAIPLLVTNALVFGIIVLHYTKKLPSMISNPLHRIFEFEVSRGMAILALIILIGGYCVFTVPEISQADPWEDYTRTVRPELEKWSISEPFSLKSLVYFLGNTSMQIFGTYRVVPLIASIAMLLLTYFITLEIAKKRFAGLVAVVVLVQSGNFLTYDTTITYPNFWGALYLFSLYLIFKKWYGSAISFVGSFLTKTLAFGLFPFSLAFAALADIPKRRKIAVIASFSVLPILGIPFMYYIDNRIVDIQSFDSLDFLSSLTILSTQFRYDITIVLFLLPVVFGVFIRAKNRFANANAVQVLIFGMLLLAVLIPALSTYTNSPYRFVPFSAFFAIAVGTILASKVRLDELQSSKQ